jgi:hypothetical protein
MPEIIAELASIGPAAAPFECEGLVVDVVDVIAPVLMLFVADIVGVAVGEAEVG